MCPATSIVSVAWRLLPVSPMPPPLVCGLSVDTEAPLQEPRRSPGPHLYRVSVDGRDIMPPAMGQPINVVEKPSRTPGLARRLFDSGGVTSVHVNGSVVTVALSDGWAGEQLLDVIRGLYIHYPAAE